MYRKLGFIFILLSISVFSSDITDIKIGMIISNLENPFFQEMKDGAIERAKQSNINLEVVSSEDSPVKELRKIKKFLEEGKDIIIINPSNSHAVSRGIVLSNEKKIPIITVDREAIRGETETHIGSNNIAGGSLAGQYLLKHLGKGARIIELEGNYETTASINRSRGFNQVSAGNFGAVIRANGGFEKEQSYNVMKRLLMEEQEIDGVFAHNDESALGAQKAIEESGRDIIVVGFDGTKEAMESIVNGGLTATIRQNPYEMGYLAVETAIKKIKKEWINKKIDVEVQLIDKETLTE